MSFQIGLFAGMWFHQEVLFAPGLAKTTAPYWLVMQLAMIVGFFTAWPVNGWPVRAGRKEKMRLRPTATALRGSGMFITPGTVWKSQPPGSHITE
ncbi:DUF4396 domain-containing protein [Streptomyces pseudovenezuelae]|uniref:DUF4396 domain-containing protein n=1 Tax=Streptomyces pseudovenezuelae TaxID=67350 RepID=A0ABZ1XBF5_9ACTN|nr:DUF4396 domain-containing protein [Streptomyces pseudovenezuelae]